jgi:hypothetical protein
VSGSCSSCCLGAACSALTAALLALSSFLLLSSLDFKAINLPLAIACELRCCRCIDESALWMENAEDGDGCVVQNARVRHQSARGVF